MNVEASATVYRRNLPHWHPERSYLFLTWRLHGTLPCGTGTLACAAEATKDNPTETAGQRFKRLDSELDRMKAGPKWLTDSRVAACVEASILRGDAVLKQYELHAYVVMPNHVHLLIRPRIELKRITKGIKGVSACAANRILGRRGKTFWQDETFDHWVRDEREYGKIRFYIEYNPVAAGLVKRPEEWRWGSTWFQGGGLGADAGAQARVPVPQE